MKYKEEDRLYYSNPFIFHVEPVIIKMAVKENGHIYYIDEVGAWLAEWDLFDTIEEAKGDAIKKLNKFYGETMTKIMKFGNIENNGEGY